MARGGRRDGAGRPLGAVDLKTRAIIEAALSGGETPFAYVLRVMRDEKIRDARRDDMAKVAVAYLAKLSRHWDGDTNEGEPASDAVPPSEPQGRESENMPPPHTETSESTHADR